MLRRVGTRLALPINNRLSKRYYGAPGAPKIVSYVPRGLTGRYLHHDILVNRVHQKSNMTRVLGYLGKHVPFPQKSLWSPDTPIPQDSHLFKLTTLDIDSFKYWFGVRRALVDRTTWKLLWRAGLLPPSYYQNNPLTPRPVFDKEELMKYYLRNRKPLAVQQREDYLNYKNSLIRTADEKAADRPKAPWL